MRFLKKYWPEFLVFGIILVAYLVDVAPVLTRVNVNSDGGQLTWAARNLYLAHKTSAPLFLVLGHFVQMIPIGTEFFRMGLISVVFGLGTSIIIYLTIRTYLGDIPKARWYALVGAIVYGGSALAFSQTVIVKYYTMVTFFSVAAYYFVLRKQWKSSAAMLALGIGTHHLIGFVVIILFLFHREFRHWKPILITLSGALFYLYFPFSVYVMHAPTLWSNTTLITAASDLFATFFYLVGQLSIWDFPQRVLNIAFMVGLSLTLALIPITVWFWKQKKILKTELFWLFIIFIVYFSVDLDFSTYTYMLPAIAFGAIIAGIGLSKLKPQFLYATGFASIALFAFNTNAFDVGRVLDKNLTGQEFYTQELPKIPDGQILLSQGGWDWCMVFVYNSEYKKNIIPIYNNTMVYKEYQAEMRAKGIKFETYDDIEDLAVRQAYICASIVRDNPNVWESVVTVPEEYGLRIQKATIETQMKLPPRTTAKDIFNLADYNWKPVNPYAYIMGKVEMKDWVFITYTYGTRSCLFFISWAAAGLLLNKALWWFLGRGKHETAKTIHAKDRNETTS